MRYTTEIHPLRTKNVKLLERGDIIYIDRKKYTN